MPASAQIRFEEQVFVPAPSSSDGSSWSGVAYTDGSMRFLMPLDARRAGWSVISLTHLGTLNFARFGTCPDLVPTAHRSEVWAVLMALRFASGSVAIVTDCLEVVRAFALGPEFCCHSSRPAADLWRDIWSLVNSLGGPAHVSIRWCRGHCTADDVRGGRIDPTDWYGNTLADEYAAKGVDLAVAQVPAAALVAHHEQATRWYRWLLRLVANWPTDVTAPSERTAPVSASSRGLPPAPWRSAHELWNNAPTLSCSLCSRFCLAPAQWPVFRRSPCPAAHLLALPLSPAGCAFVHSIGTHRSRLLSQGFSPHGPLTTFSHAPTQADSATALAWVLATFGPHWLSALPPGHALAVIGESLVFCTR